MNDTATPTRSLSFPQARQMPIRKRIPDDQIRGSFLDPAQNNCRRPLTAPQRGRTSRLWCPESGGMVCSVSCLPGSLGPHRVSNLCTTDMHAKHRSSPPSINLSQVPAKQSHSCAHSHRHRASDLQINRTAGTNRAFRWLTPNPAPTNHGCSSLSRPQAPKDRIARGRGFWRVP